MWEAKPHGLRHKKGRGGFAPYKTKRLPRPDHHIYPFEFSDAPHWDPRWSEDTNYDEAYGPRNPRKNRAEKVAARVAWEDDPRYTAAEIRADLAVTVERNIQYAEAMHALIADLQMLTVYNRQHMESWSWEAVIDALGLPHVDYPQPRKPVETTPLPATELWVKARQAASMLDRSLSWVQYHLVSYRRPGESGVWYRIEDVREAELAPKVKADSAPSVEATIVAHAGEIAKSILDKPKPVAVEPVSSFEMSDQHTVTVRESGMSRFPFRASCSCGKFGRTFADVKAVERAVKRHLQS